MTAHEVYKSGGERDAYIQRNADRHRVVNSEDRMQDETGKRELWPAIANGVRCRCPRCGIGRLYRAYLKIADVCPHCGLELGNARADDLPAYIAITIVGHILVVGLFEFQAGAAGIPPWVYLLGMCFAAIALPLVLLPSIKGAVVGLQFANRMHGF
ncbi:DUF983 domain-containing protein [Devosia sp. LjRoot16]|jgi:uncharacterized protein (DUF983 family)|uniref:DUF983 domain-containing protein n=1 Tax=Devosia sp. LjRoot16 TaxID=3342271 RepID=UPI003F4FE171